MDRMKRRPLGLGGAILAAGLLWGAGGCGRPSGSFVPYIASVADAQPADRDRAAALMEDLAGAQHFQIEPAASLPPGSFFFATHEKLLLAMGGEVVAGQIHLHVSAMAPRLNQNAARRKLLADLDAALRSAFGDRLVVP